MLSKHVSLQARSIRQVKAHSWDDMVQEKHSSTVGRKASSSTMEINTEFPRICEYEPLNKL